MSICFQTRHPSGVRGLGAASAGEAKGGVRHRGEGGARPSAHIAGIIGTLLFFLLFFVVFASSWMEALLCLRENTLLLVLIHTRTYHTR